MIEKLYFRCPCCGMVSDVDRLNRSHKIKIWTKRLGGKIPGENKGRGKAKGLLEFKDVTRSHQDIIERIMERVRDL
jgi:hypothetical protein